MMSEPVDVFKLIKEDDSDSLNMLFLGGNRCDLYTSDTISEFEKEQINLNQPRLSENGNINVNWGIQSAYSEALIGENNISQDVENSSCGNGQSTCVNSDDIVCSLSGLFCENDKEDYKVDKISDNGSLGSSFHCSAPNKGIGCKPSLQEEVPREEEVLEDAVQEFEHENICKDSGIESKLDRVPNCDLCFPSHSEVTCNDELEKNPFHHVSVTSRIDSSRSRGLEYVDEVDPKELVCNSQLDLKLEEIKQLNIMEDDMSIVFEKEREILSENIPYDIRQLEVLKKIDENLSHSIENQVNFVNTPNEVKIWSILTNEPSWYDSKLYVKYSEIISYSGVKVTGTPFKSEMNQNLLNHIFDLSTCDGTMTCKKNLEIVPSLEDQARRATDICIIGQDQDSIWTTRSSGQGGFSIVLAVQDEKEILEPGQLEVSAGKETTTYNTFQEGVSNDSLSHCETAANFLAKEDVGVSQQDQVLITQGVDRGYEKQNQNLHIQLGTNDQGGFPSASAACQDKEKMDAEHKEDLPDTQTALDPNLELNSKYDVLKVTIKQRVDPEIDITATYLWSASCAEIVESYEKDAVNPKGIIRVNNNCALVGDLPDGTRVNVLVDTGASKNIINEEFLKRSEQMQSYPITRIQEVSLKMANNQKEVVNKMITFMIYLDGHMFEFSAFVMNCGTSFDFILGVKSLFELEANLDLTKLKIDFQMRTLPIHCHKDITILPKKEVNLPFPIRNLPRELNHTFSQVISKMTTGQENMYMHTEKLWLHHGSVAIIINNTSVGKVIKLKKGNVIGYLDMRSLGYFYVPRLGIQQTMKNYFQFLTDNEMDLFCDHIKSVLPSSNNEKPTLEKEKKIRKDQVGEENDPYPWLDDDDPRRDMTDKEIIKTYIKIDQEYVSDRVKDEVYDAIFKYKEAFSLRDEVGVCPDLEVHLDVMDKRPFFLRPFPVKEEEKAIVDKQMRKGCLLGILKKGMSSYSSPIMLIPRKLGGIPRIVTDFRYLNSRLVKLNPSIPLVKDAMQLLGAAEVEVISVVDLRDAYHTLRLDKESRQYCGITPYYGSPTYLYLRMPMGLQSSPALWMKFITDILDKMMDRKHHLAIMDDCLIHSDLESHLSHLISLFQSLIKNGLKISPKKCQLYRKELVYMGHTILVQDHGACITPLRNNVDPILKLPACKTAKDCKSFCGMVNFLGMYLPKLQELLIPIYKLTRKGVKFEWNAECQENFEKIKGLLVKPPILSMPKPFGRFTLVSDTSKYACGSTLYQMQAGKNRILGYASKSLPEPASRYGISELELCGLVVNIHSFKHLLRGPEFDVWVDHSALVHILRGKREPPTLRIKKLLEALLDFNFIIHYMKGKDMKITDFLSRHPVDNGEGVSDIIPISFHIRDYYKIDHEAMLEKLVPNKIHWCNKCKVEMTKEVVMALTRSRAKAEGIELPSVKPFANEKSLTKPPNEIEERRIDKGLEKGMGMDQINRQIRDLIQKERIEREDELINNQLIPRTRNLENYPRLNRQIVNNPQVRPEVLRPVNEGMFTRNQLLQENLKPGIEETEDYEVSDDFIRPPEESMYRRPITLVEKIRDSSIFRKHIPRQSELDRYLNIMKQKIIHGYKLPITLQEMKHEYIKSPYFKDIYKYVKNGITSLTGSAGTTFKIMCQDYIIVEELLFKLNPMRGDKSVFTLDCVLCIPEAYIPSVLYQYHNLFLSGHQGISRMFYTLRSKYFFPNMMDCIRKYILSCHACQSRRGKGESMDVTFARIPLDFKPMKRFSMDVKHMPEGRYGLKYILFCTCEVSNYVEGIPIREIKSDIIANAIYTNIICRYGRVTTAIMDQASYFTSELIKSIFGCLNITPIIVSPENHGSNRTERYIRTLNEMMCKHLQGTGINWPMYVKPVCFAMNTFVSPILGYSAHQLVYLNDPPNPLGYEFDFDRKGISVPVSEYLQFMKNRKNVMRNIILERTTLDKQTQVIRNIRKNPNQRNFCVGDLVFMFAPTASSLVTNSRKFKQEWIGPLKIHGIVDDTHYIVSDLNGEVLEMSVHYKRLKFYHYNMNEIKDEKLVTFDNMNDLLEYLRKRDRQKGKEYKEEG